MSAVITMEKPVVIAVDDSREMLDILKSVIAGAGYRFFGASNAQQCMRLVRDVEPDLILLDIQMPEVDGFELAGRSAPSRRSRIFRSRSSPRGARRRM